MSKIVIVMTYFERLHQLDMTLRSIEKTKHKDLEIIIVDDCSLITPQLAYMNHDLSITLLRTMNKQWIDGSPAYNLGIIEAMKSNPDIIILQNAECYHVGDIIQYAEKVTDENYVSFGCYNLSKEWTFLEHDLSWIITNNNGTAFNNDNDAWLNCSRRPMGYHWCSAISASNMRKLNGFDERFSDGYCFEDDEFLARVKMLGLKIEITDFPFVVHQWHERLYVPKNWNELFRINQALCEQVRSEGNPVAVHKFTANV